MPPSFSDSEFEHFSSKSGQSCDGPMPQNTICARGRIALSGGGLRPLKDRAAELGISVFSKSGRNLGSGRYQVKA